MVLVVGALGLVLLVYLVLRLLTSRSAVALRREPVPPPRPPDDDEDFLRDLRRRMRDPRDE